MSLRAARTFETCRARYSELGLTIQSEGGGREEKKKKEEEEEGACSERGGQEKQKEPYEPYW